MGRHRRQRRRRHYRRSHVQQQGRKGWGANLYRDTRNGKIAGVCAGLAKHFDLDPWVMRFIFIGALLFL